jgi:type I restriction enzyme M protein
VAGEGGDDFFTVVGRAFPHDGAEDLDEFVACYNPKNRHDRKPTWNEKAPDGRWRAYAYDELIGRDKASLDIFWLKDESLEDSDNLPDPAVIAAEIAEDLRSALEQFEAIAEDLNGQASATFHPQP